MGFWEVFINLFTLTKREKWDIEQWKIGVAGFLWTIVIMLILFVFFLIYEFWKELKIKKAKKKKQKQREQDR